MKYPLIVLVLTVLFCCKSSKEIDARWARDRNVAKTLKGKTVVYTIFIDSKTTKPWSRFDISSTKDSLNKVYSWLKNEGSKYAQDFEIIPVYGALGAKPTIKKKLPYSTISAAFSGSDNDGGKLQKWASGIVKKLEKGIKLPNSQALPKKPKLDAFHKLVAKLKIKYNADNVVVFFMLNNYYIEDASAVLHYMQDEECEYAINSGKNTNLYAAQLLTLFGAQNLNSKGYSSYQVKEIALAEQDFPTDVMHDFEADLFNLSIGEYTAYLIGWLDNINTKYIDLLKIEPVKKKKNEKYK